nr:IGHMBP2 family helicase [Chitinophagaceae bacterium]
KLRGHQVLVAAPSNAAVDHMTRGLLAAGVKAVRVGNSVKIADDLFSATPEGRLNDKNIQKEIKALKIRAEEFRKMALQYKRRFGKAEREQRNLLFAEVKSIRQEIRKTMDYHLDKIFSNAEVILGTPLALAEQRFKPQQFHALFIDEAAQCLEPLAWGIMPLAKHTVLAGDHFQLPPTVLSQKATQLGLNISILETAIRNIEDQVLLDTQYRMRTVIAGFSNDYFYQGALQTPDHLNNESVHMTFIDTAGTGMEEEAGQEGTSLVNRGELDLVQKIIQSEKLNPESIAFISPYAAQVSLANELLQKIARISTIDSFQGQEFHTVFISLVRSNEHGQIGFLDDVRRMNVALTRAQEKLYVIGDSATLGQHPFYKKYLEYVEKAGHYISAWEWMYD